MPKANAASIESSHPPPPWIFEKAAHLAHDLDEIAGAPDLLRALADGSVSPLALSCAARGLAKQLDRLASSVSMLASDALGVASGEDAP